MPKAALAIAGCAILCIAMALLGQGLSSAASVLRDGLFDDFW